MPEILLDPNSAFVPLTGPATITSVSGTPSYKRIDFNDTFTQNADWIFKHDQYYDSGNMYLDIYWMAASATSGSVVWGTLIRGVSVADGFAGGPSLSWSITSATDTTAAGNLNKATITITSPGLSPAQIIQLWLRRVPGDAGDNMTGDAHFLFASLRYTVSG